MNIELTKEEKMLLYKYNNNIYELMRYEYDPSSIVKEDKILELIDKLDEIGYDINWEGLFNYIYNKNKASIRCIKKFKSKIDLWEFINDNFAHSSYSVDFWKELKLLIPYGYLTKIYESYKEYSPFLSLYSKKTLLYFMSDKERLEFVNKYPYIKEELKREGMY